MRAGVEAGAVVCMCVRLHARVRVCVCRLFWRGQAESRCSIKQQTDGTVSSRHSTIPRHMSIPKHGCIRSPELPAVPLTFQSQSSGRACRAAFLRTIEIAWFAAFCPHSFSHLDPRAKSEMSLKLTCYEINAFVLCSLRQGDPDPWWC